MHISILGLFPIGLLSAQILILQCSANDTLSQFNLNKINI